MRVEIREDCGRYQLEISDEEMEQDGQPPQISLTEGEAAQLVEYLAAARAD